MPPYFSPEGFRAIIVRALGFDYRVTPFKKFEMPTRRPILLLRHDLDHSIRSAMVMAEMEAELGVCATYFIQIACDFYNLLSTESRRLVRGIAGLGHEIGLHYEAQRYQGPEARASLRRDLDLLESLSDQRIVSASQHLPIEGNVSAIDDLVENEAYHRRFTEPPMTYISDSLMTWRQATPHQLLDGRVSFQFLAHPMKWHRPVRTMQEALDLAKRDEQAHIADCYVNVADRYRRLLRDRERLDAAFIQRRKNAG